jgi:hypothetical protein
MFFAAQPSKEWTTRFGLDINDCINKLMSEKREIIDDDHKTYD